MIYNLTALKQPHLWQLMYTNQFKMLKGSVYEMCDSPYK